MAWAILMHFYAIPALGVRLLLAIPAEGWRHAWKRIPLFVLLWILFSVLNLQHIIGHLLDELLFFSYRKVPVKAPVFILGIPRSGTTFLQRLLARDTNITTLTTWEALLAPSITERYFYSMLGWLLSPLRRLAGHIRRPLLQSMDDIHKIALTEPEEDFLLLLPVQACLLLAFLCPNSTHFWQLGFFDRDLPAAYRNRVLDFYTLCLKKHLYFHGRDKILLSKNPSFTPMLDSLLVAFPEGQFIACTRDPSEVIPSQLSSLRPAMKFFGSGRLSPTGQEKTIALLHHYYALLGNHAGNNRVLLLPMHLLVQETQQAMETLSGFLAIPWPESIQRVMSDIDAPSTSPGMFASKHEYSLEEFSLVDEFIETRFADVWPLPAGTETRIAE